MNIYILLSLGIVTFFCITAQVNVDELRTENRLQPDALDVLHPRFSWQLQSAKRAAMQTAYEREVMDEWGKNYGLLVKLFLRKVYWFSTAGRRCNPMLHTNDGIVNLLFSCAHGR